MALEGALVCDDQRLLEPQTVSPLPWHPHACRPVQGAFPIAFAGWKGDGLLIVAELEEFCDPVITRAGEGLGDRTGARNCQAWRDDSPRGEARRQLLAEVRRELARRHRKAGAA